MTQLCDGIFNRLATILKVEQSTGGGWN